jgi:hypothetical protein
VRESPARPGGRVIVQFGIAGVGGLGCAIGYDSRRSVALPEFDTVRVELMGRDPRTAMSNRCAHAVRAGPSRAELGLDPRVPLHLQRDHGGRVVVLPDVLHIYCG